MYAVVGIWQRDEQQSEAQVQFLLDSEAAALAFKAGVEANSQNQAAHGVAMELLTVVEVIAALPSHVERHSL